MTLSLYLWLTLEAFSLEAIDGTMTLSELYWWIGMEFAFLFLLKFLLSNLFWFPRCLFLWIFLCTLSPDFVWLLELWNSNEFASCSEDDKLSFSSHILSDSDSDNVEILISWSSSLANIDLTYFSNCIFKRSLLMCLSNRIFGFSKNATNGEILKYLKSISCDVILIDNTFVLPLVFFYRFSLFHISTIVISI